MRLDNLVLAVLEVARLFKQDAIHSLPEALHYAQPFVQQGTIRLAALLHVLLFLLDAMARRARPQFVQLLANVVRFQLAVPRRAHNVQQGSSKVTVVLLHVANVLQEHGVVQMLQVVQM